MIGFVLFVKMIGGEIWFDALNAIHGCMMYALELDLKKYFMIVVNKNIKFLNKNVVKLSLFSGFY